MHLASGSEQQNLFDLKKKKTIQTKLGFIYVTQ